MCGSWYLPMLRLRGGVLYTYEHCFLDSPGLALDLLVYDIKLIRIQRVSCGGAV